MKTRTPLLTILALFCSAFLPNLQAVSPPPDGGYSGGNTAEGESALLNLTTGGYNTAIGFYSLKNDTMGGFNTAIGAGALLANWVTENNTATGAGALLNNFFGNENTANGAFALFYNTADQNSAFGSYALFFNSSGSQNTAIGQSAMYENQSGEGNTAVGFSALEFNREGWDNTAIGVNAGLEVTGSGNICIGSGADGFPGQDGAIQIGGDFSGQNACYISGIYGKAADPSTAQSTYIDADGKLGTMLSSQRYKRDIQPMDKASEAIHLLKPVTFHYNNDKKNTPCFGLVAEDVAAVNPDLVLRDKNGQVLSVRYEAVNAMLLNEFLKGHKAFLEEQGKMEKLETALAAANERLKELEAKIERVSAQVETSRATAQIVSNQ